MYDAKVVNVTAGRVCLNIKYVSGGIKQCFVQINCTSEARYLRSKTINGTEDCIDVQPHPSYVFRVTDSDKNAEKIIDTRAPVTLTVSVPSSTNPTPLG